MTRPGLRPETKQAFLTAIYSSFSGRFFVSFVLFVAQILCGKNVSHKGHEEHKGQMRSRLTK